MATTSIKKLTREQTIWQRVYDRHEPQAIFLRVFCMRDTIEEGKRKFCVDLDEPPTFVNLARCNCLVVGRRRAEGEKNRGIGYDDAEKIEFVRVVVRFRDEFVEGFAVKEEAEDAAARCGVYCNASAPKEGEE